LARNDGILSNKKAPFKGAFSFYVIF
jgi:hypothetical protein